jgi:L-2-hydroxyglutarate oxidase LhgO
MNQTALDVIVIGGGNIGSATFKFLVFYTPQGGTEKSDRF